MTTSTTNNHGQVPDNDRPLPWIISVDDHVVEPPTVWSDRLPKKYEKLGPRVERRRIAQTKFVGSNFEFVEGDDGRECDVWVYEDIIKPMRRNIAAAGLSRNEMDMEPIDYDVMRPGCYDPHARLTDMDLNHVEASLCFPQFPRFCGQEFTEAKDRDLGLLCIKAYNDWMVEEWSGTSPKRLIPLCLIPLWDGELAAAEVRRNAARGVHAVAFSENPSALGLSSIHSGDWEPFFQACEETDTTICMHIGSSSKMTTTAADAPPAVTISLSSQNAISSLMDYLFSGILVRYASLKLAYSEGQVGWIPFFLERADNVWEDHHAWNGLGDSIPERPSFYFHRQVYGCVFRDFFGLKSLDDVGIANVTFETDYPHTDSTWPDTERIAKEMFAGLDDDAVYQIVRGNAIRMLSLDLL